MMKTRVRILEYKPDDFMGEIICLYTGTKHSHTEIIIDDTLYSVGRGITKPFFFKERVELADIKYDRPFDTVPVDGFSDEQINRMVEWCDNECRVKRLYGFLKLLTYAVTVPLMPLYRLYYKMTGKVWRPITEVILKNSRTCAETVDRVLKIGGKDIFKEIPEAVVYPGMFYIKLVGEGMKALAKICTDIKRIESTKGGTICLSNQR